MVSQVLCVLYVVLMIKLHTPMQRIYHMDIAEYIMQI
jgi:hypothetical protein